jgi:hypothetical protein
MNSKFTLWKTASFIFVCFLTFSASANHIYTNYGTSQSYNLTNRDTLTIVNGTYTGALNVFTPGAVVIVYSNATFKPSYINTPGGTIINYGITTFTYSFGAQAYFFIDNYYVLNFQRDLALYSGSSKSITNNYGATMTINGSLSLNANSSILNKGNLIIKNTFSMYASSSDFTNEGTTTISGNFNISNGDIVNEDIINIDGDFNFWGGDLDNQGSINPEGDFVNSASTTYTNSCKMVTKKGFVNYGTFQNNGVLWVGTTGTSADKFYNSGTFIANPGSKVKAVDMTNYGSIKGSGYLYFTGSTYTSGTIGRSGTTTDSIFVFDATHSNSNKIFDTQWGTVYNNTVFRSFAVPDTNEMIAGCSAIYRTTGLIPLPVKWNYFYVKTMQNQPTLFWSAEYEADMKFEIERSYDNSNFSVIKTSTSNTNAVYSYTDNAADMKIATVYYRIKGTSITGEVKYTETRVVKNAQQSTVSFKLFPNPTTSSISVNYKSEKNGSVIVRIKNLSGQQLMLKNMTANTGMNTLQLDEVKNFVPGIYYIDIISGDQIIAAERFVKQ